MHWKRDEGCLSVCQSRLHTDGCFSITCYIALIVRHCWLDMPVLYLTSDIVPIQNKFTLWALLFFFFFCYHFRGDKYLFWSPVPLPYSPIPQPKQGASSMEDCLNLHGSNVGLQLGLWRVGLSYKPSGQINHLLCAWLPLQYRLSSVPIVWVTFIRIFIYGTFSGI